MGQHLDVAQIGGLDVPSTKALRAALYSAHASPTAALSWVYMGSTSILGAAVIIFPVFADKGVCNVLDVSVGEAPSICGMGSVRCSSAGSIVGDCEGDKR